jgi:dTDP-4-dehydrorhamnose 3,5-epimerase
MRADANLEQALEVASTPLPGLLILKPRRLEDVRGFFCESYNKRRLAEIGVDTDFVQDNLSFSPSVGTLRGLHFQREPFAQTKLVSVLRGAALDVAVDLRRNSKTFGRHFSLVLNATEGNQLLIPAGFAHGFATLEPETLFAYKASNYYSPMHDTGIRFDDPQLAIDWSKAGDALTASKRDRTLPFFNPQAEYFA